MIPRSPKREKEYIVAELEFSPNFNPYKFDKELSELREKIEARKKL